MDIFFTYGSWWTPLPPAYGKVTLENNVFGHTYKDDGTWHYYSVYVANTANAGGTARRLDGPQQHLRDPGQRRARRHGRLALGGQPRQLELRGGHALQPQRRRRSAPPRTSASRPPCRRPRSIAPLGWIDPGAFNFRLKAGAPAINAADPDDHPATRPRRLRARRPPGRRGPRVRRGAPEERARHTRRAARRRHAGPAEAAVHVGPPPAARDLQAAAPRLPRAPRGSASA